jgi:SAM-dependent methyltransferase
VEPLTDSYAPGWADDAVAMMARRTAESRAGFILPFLRPGMRVLDIGCGPGTITLGLARAVSPGGSCVGIDMAASQIELARAAARDLDADGVAFETGSVYALPFADGSLDLVHSHAMFEHLARPDAALAEIRRVLRPGGIVGICSSDWAGAIVDPRTDDVEIALRCHLQLRRRAGGDPFTGGRLPGWIEDAGFVDASATVQHEVEMSYGAFGRYVGTRIEAAAHEAPEAERAALLEGAAAARRWSAHEGGSLSQPWTAVTARRP